MAGAHSRDLSRDPIQMPFIAGSGQLTPDLVANTWPNLTPLPNGLMADNDAASSEDLVHVAQAERKAETEPHSVADDLSREAKPGVVGEAAVVTVAGYATQLTSTSQSVRISHCLQGRLSYRCRSMTRWADRHVLPDSIGHTLV
jgi:hypothetical protein